MTEEKLTSVERHEGRPVGVKVLAEFDPAQAERLIELSEQAGLSLADYLKRLVEEAATARSRQ